LQRVIQSTHFSVYSVVFGAFVLFIFELFICFVDLLADRWQAAVFSHSSTMLAWWNSSVSMLFPRDFLSGDMEVPACDKSRSS
jgi:hypothetical protein